MASMKLLTAEEIAQLPRWAIVAFAARCARRAQPIFELFWAGPKKHKKAVANAVQVAERVALRGKFPYTYNIRRAHNALYAATRAVFATAGKATNAGKAYAAACAANAAEYAIITANDCSAYSAANAIDYASAAYSQITTVSDAIIADFEKLKQSAKKEHWTDETLVRPKFFGPLWPDGEPNLQVIIAKSIKKFRDREPMSLYFDRTEFSNKEIAEIISMLSELYHDVSGDRLVIDKTMQFTPVGEPVPEGV